MNFEQRQKQMDPPLLKLWRTRQIHRLERLLDFAEQIRDEGEVERIRQELMALVEECGDGSCAKCGG